MVILAGINIMCVIITDLRCFPSRFKVPVKDPGRSRTAARKPFSLERARFCAQYKKRLVIMETRKTSLTAEFKGVASRSVAIGANGLVFCTLFQRWVWSQDTFRIDCLLGPRDHSSKLLGSFSAERYRLDGFITRTNQENFLQVISLSSIRTGYLHLGNPVILLVCCDIKPTNCAILNGKWKCAARWWVLITCHFA